MNFFYDRIFFKYDNVKKIFISRTSTVKLIWNEKRLQNARKYLPKKDLKNVNIKSGNFSIKESLENTAKYRSYFMEYFKDLISGYKDICFIDIGWEAVNIDF